MSDRLRGWLFEIPWLAFLFYWAISAFRTQRTAKQDRFAGRYFVMLLTVAGFVLVFRGDTNIAALDRPIFPYNSATWYVGVAMVWIGIGLAIWARWHLGEYWSGRVTIKENHKLIRSGPYALLRHPIYSGLDLAVIGSVLAIDRRRCLVGLFVVILGFAIKAKREEAMLAAQFGAEFEEHRRNTGFLLPKIG